ncbi:MAG: glycosyltransferase family 2 protein [Candidatus Omnitrophica bacterium]|nr:glycosyltransferase family 2 protein [Candidatus Omnitrophota bacterium]
MPDIKCDIIIPVWNEREFTERCIESIANNTDVSHRVILVDNASDAETAVYLKELSEKNKGAVILIRNEENIGFPKAVNQGIAISNAPYRCILNNDTEVYKGWLEEMIKIAESNSLIGIVNPSSNNLGQPQPMEGFSGKWIEMSSCIGFCMLIKKEVIGKIGKLDEIYSPGNFEDTDFSRRAAKAGYKCVMAKGAYVYHGQNTGFKKRKDWDEGFKRNLDIFNKRWGKIERIVYIIGKEDRYGAIKESVDSFLKAGHFVQIIFKCDIPSGIKEHASLRIFKVKSSITILWRVLMRKKRFNKIFTDSKFLTNIFHMFRYKTISPLKREGSA